ncbi:MAG TPA: maleylpyruvate isomerase family mycothiol-dependent enzyme [Pseudonocardia sp.]|nr:maleylpyruvate isomerase family mycothiol-dependent enzyme [Pseudonocardia sp.]
MFDRIYARARERVTGIARDLTPAQLDARVPATPLWTARQLVAHVTGVASDAAHGRTEGMPGAAWTAGHVSAREGRPLDDVLAEWAEVGPAIQAALAGRRMPVVIVHDLLTHEGDLREASGLPPVPLDDLEPALEVLARGVCRRVEGPGTLVLRSGNREWTGGDGEPRVSVEVGPGELYRGLMSRRTVAEMRAWPWSGDPEPYLTSLPVFGPARTRAA